MDLPVFFESGPACPLCERASLYTRYFIAEKSVGRIYTSST